VALRQGRGSFSPCRASGRVYRQRCGSQRYGRIPTQPTCRKLHRFSRALGLRGFISELAANPDGGPLDPWQVRVPTSFTNSSGVSCSRSSPGNSISIRAAGLVCVPRASPTRSCAARARSATSSREPAPPAPLLTPGHTCRHIHTVRSSHDGSAQRVRFMNARNPAGLTCGGPRALACESYYLPDLSASASASASSSASPPAQMTTARLREVVGRAGSKEGSDGKARAPPGPA
jgi:hypothetical protein